MPKAVGIDIGTRTITLAEVSTVRGVQTITNFGGTQLPEDAVREGEILDTQLVVSTLKKLLESTGTRTKKVHLGVANQRVVVRQVDLPWSKPDELQASLRYQVQEYLPIPVEEAELGVHVVEEFQTEQGERWLRALLVGAHRDMVASHVAAATGAGLKPQSVDLNPFAALRAIGTTDQLDRGNEVVVDVGGGVTGIVVHQAGTPVFVRILVLGGDDITGALAAATSVSAQDAEATKRTVAVGGGGADLATRVVTDRARIFVDEIRSSLDFYQSQPGAERLTNVVLTGGGALLEGLADRLADVLRLPVEVGSVFDRCPVKGTVHGPEELRRIGPSLTVAAGLALGGLE